MILIEVSIPGRFKNETIAVYSIAEVNWTQVSRLLNRYLRAMAFKHENKKLDFADCTHDNSKQTVTLEVNGDLWVGSIRNTRTVVTLEDAIKAVEDTY